MHRLCLFLNVSFFLISCCVSVCRAAASTSPEFRAADVQTCSSLKRPEWLKFTACCKYTPSLMLCYFYLIWKIKTKPKNLNYLFCLFERKKNIYWYTFFVCLFVLQRPSIQVPWLVTHMIYTKKIYTIHKWAYIKHEKSLTFTQAAHTHTHWCCPNTLWASQAATRSGRKSRKSTWVNTFYSLLIQNTS